MATKIPNWLQVGLLLRGEIRRELTKAGIEFTETKGVLESVFIIPDDDDFRRVQRALKNSGHEIET